MFGSLRGFRENIFLPPLFLFLFFVCVFIDFTYESERQICMTVIDANWLKSS